MEKRLKSLLKSPASITITDNSSSIISVKRQDYAYTVRLHHMFLDADKPVLKALADYITGKSKRSNKLLKAFIKDNERKIRKRPESTTPRRVRIKTRGQYFDLMDSFLRLNQNYFQGKVDSSITWGNHRRRSRYRSVRLGSYSPKSSIIRINPVLDRSFVPQFVVDDIIYHEMLHHVLGFEMSNGRRLSHHKTFKKMENMFIHRDKARLWIKKNLPRLMRYKKR